MRRAVAWSRPNRSDGENSLHTRDRPLSFQILMRRAASLLTDTLGAARENIDVSHKSGSNTGHGGQQFR